MAARGWCDKHYRRWKRHGSVDTLHRHPTPEASFLAKVRPEGDCLVWQGTLRRDGYGQLWTGEKSGLAHRYAWEREHGPIPDGVFVDHACHNRACVRVSHLRLATRDQNAQNRRGATVRSSTGARNVQRYKGLWRTRVRHAGRLYGKDHATKEEAMAEAEKLRIELFGEFAGAA